MTHIDVKIDKDVPIPIKVTVRVPIGSLEVGESVQFPLAKRSSVAAQASRLAARTGKKFTVHKESEQHARVWRTQ